MGYTSESILQIKESNMTCAFFRPSIFDYFFHGCIMFNAAIYPWEERPLHCLINEIVADKIVSEPLGKNEVKCLPYAPTPLLWVVIRSHLGIPMG